jgi:hypothetical protein
MFTHFAGEAPAGTYMRVRPSSTTTHTHDDGAGGAARGKKARPNHVTANGGGEEKPLARGAGGWQSMRVSWHERTQAPTCKGPTRRERCGPPQRESASCQASQAGKASSIVGVGGKGAKAA